MWSYYGSKSKLVRHYPLPKHPLIIEPFAGSAWYSVTHRNHEILLNDVYDKVANIWKFLVDDATKEMILAHKDFNLGDIIDDLPIDVRHKDLIGFCINRGGTSPKRTVTRWSCQQKARPEYASTTEYALLRIAKLIPEIKHFEVSCVDYRALDNVEATWFIDPPYQFGGEHYVHSDIDYVELAEWCKGLRGQVIVCENSRGNWLPFNPLKEIYGQSKNSVESMWTND